LDFLMGVDLGTSSVKACIADRVGTVVSIGGSIYSFDSPKYGYAEQNLWDWWSATKTAIAKALKKLDASQIANIRCIGLSGQMHGLVCIDRNGKQIRPAILHCDQRTQQEIHDIYDIVSKEELGNITLNQLSTGFLLPSLMWVKKNEPKNYAAIWKVMLPKDFIRFEMTGEIGTEYSDASGTLAFDVVKQEWAFDVIQRLGLRKDIFPPCSPSAAIAGGLRREVANELGLREGIPVVFGGADQPMQALGNGVIEPGMATSTIGTSGQIFVVQSQPVLNKSFNTNLFCNALPESWYSMGAIMSAGIALKWLTSKIIHNTDLNELDGKAADIAPGSEGVIFLPYLMGERTPHLDPNAKGMFFGLSIKHDYRHLIRAVMEGICFALKDCLVTLEQSGEIGHKEIIASGGGANSQLWKQIQADVYNREIRTTKATENACLGAIELGGIGTGIFANAQEACRYMVQYDDRIIEPNPRNVSVYEETYEKFKALYVNNKDMF